MTMALRAFFLFFCLCTTSLASNNDVIPQVGRKDIPGGRNNLMASASSLSDSKWACSDCGGGSKDGDKIVRLPSLSDSKWACSDCGGGSKDGDKIVRLPSLSDSKWACSDCGGGSKDGDKIAKLPGQPDGVGFDQYSGYVTVDDHAGRTLFYYFAEAATSNLPLVLWLNGGPGCSSFGFGALEEIGPFRVMSDGKTLYQNPYSWNTVANLLFLESPAGVGFSYSNTTSDYNTTGDWRTAGDAFVFLMRWMERFPEYKGRDFYIAGESYAGHYVPQLAHLLLMSNNPTFSLKGILMGSAVTNEKTDTKGIYDYLWTHALISDTTMAAINENCNFSPGFFSQTDACAQAIAEANKPFSTLNIFNIYAPLCFSSTVTDTPNTPSIEEFDPCTNLYVNAYLNDPNVQQALHANTSLGYPWSICSRLLTNWVDSPPSMLPIMSKILTSNVPIWLYSGDVDGRVPVTSTRYSLNLLNLPITTPWKSWSVNNEVAGYGMVYQGGLTYLTIRGAGHDVPSFQPARALAMFKSFLQGSLFSS